MVVEDSGVQQSGMAKECAHRSVLCTDVSDSSASKSNSDSIVQYAVEFKLRQGLDAQATRGRCSGSQDPALSEVVIADSSTGDSNTGTKHNKAQTRMSTTAGVMTRSTRAWAIVHCHAGRSSGEDLALSGVVEESYRSLAYSIHTDVSVSPPSKNSTTIMQHAVELEVQQSQGPDAHGVPPHRVARVQPGYNSRVIDRSN
ncbi:hypothetical protein K438DRAFT_1769948 [Mycena galopus ATCC 62051]|nr:hypothetical protein K438DRAFT_1769948 [Mycena galopus ATCC 62051]